MHAASSGYPIGWLQGSFGEKTRLRMTKSTNHNGLRNPLHVRARYGTGEPFTVFGLRGRVVLEQHLGEG